MHGAKSIQICLNCQTTIFSEQIVGNGFERIKLAGLGEKHSSLLLVQWRYSITDKGLYQMKETASLEDLHAQQQLK